MKFTPIWQQEHLYQPVVDFWKDMRAMPSNVKPEERAKELVYVVTDNDVVVGVSTASRVKMPKLNNNYFYSYRVLIHPKYRMPGLSSKITVLTRDFLEQLFLNKKTDCIGMVVFTEKTEYMTKRNEAVWKASNLMYIGSLNNGLHVRLLYFKGARI